MKNIHETISYIISDVSMTCLQHNISFNLHNEANVLYDGDGTLCSGFFNGGDTENERVLAVAFNKPTRDWVPVLLHESCHMDQYIENVKEWSDLTMPDGSDALDILFSWAAGNDAEKRVIDSMSDVDAIAKLGLRVELDCEKRTLQKIMNYNLDRLIDPIEYVMKANSYIYFYLFIREYGSFYDPNNKPYENHLVWSVAPSHFGGDYTKIPDALLKAYREHL